MRRRSGLTIVEALIVFVVLCGLWWSLIPTLRYARPKANRTKCSSNLRQLGLAAIQYADDKRFFLHVRGRAELDGGMETSDTPRKIRQLMDLGYHDNPEGWICPSSHDAYVPITDAGVKTGTAGWSWNGQVATKGGSLDTPSTAVDPTLLETTELSYGWTRKYMNSNVRSTALLGADRASRKDDALPRPPGLEGNHPNGENVLQTDGTVNWLSVSDPSAAFVADVATRTLAGGGVSNPGYLTVEPPVEAPGLSEGYRPDAELLLWRFGPPGALFVLLASGVALGGRRPGPPPAPQDASAVAKVRRSRVETLGPEERALLGASGPAGKVVLQAAQRCPMCHDGLSADEELTRCLACRAVFHADCVKVGGDCPTRGCPG